MLTVVHFVSGNGGAAMAKSAVLTVSTKEANLFFSRKWRHRNGKIGRLGSVNNGGKVWQQRAAIRLTNDDDCSMADDEDSAVGGRRCSLEGYHYKHIEGDK